MSPSWTRILLPLRYAWRNAWAHRGASAVTIFGVAISVMVYVVMTATADSLKGVAASTGDPANVVVLSKGAGSAESSRLDAPTVSAVRYAQGVQRDASGEPLASVELLGMRRIPIPGLPPDDPASQRYMSLRGVTPAALLVHPGVRIAAGRFPATSGELLLGRLVTEVLGAVGIGSEISIEGRPHRVVGVLAAEGQLFESELWMTLEDLRGRSGDREASAVVLRAAGPRAASQLVDQLEKSRQANVSAKTEVDYYAQMQRVSKAFVYLGNLIGALLGLGAVVAGANTMYATMSRRIREMGTLRALGFGRWRVGAALLLESGLVSLLGGAIGVLLAFAWNGIAFSIVSLSFELAIGPANAAAGMAMALAIGIAGGFLPARSASRLEIVAALRHV
jgi:putative ABC transport system permease protein